MSYTTLEEIRKAPCGLYRVVQDVENEDKNEHGVVYVNGLGEKMVICTGWSAAKKLDTLALTIDRLDPVNLRTTLEPKKPTPIDPMDTSSNMMFAHLVNMMAEIHGVTLSAKWSHDPEEGYFVDLTFTKEEHSGGYMEGMMNKNTRSVTVEVYVGTQYTRTPFPETAKTMLIRALQEIGVRDFATVRKCYLAPIDTKAVRSAQEAADAMEQHLRGIIQKALAGLPRTAKKEKILERLKDEFAPHIPVEVVEVTYGTMRTKVELSIQGETLVHWMEHTTAK